MLQTRRCFPLLWFSLRSLKHCLVRCMVKVNNISFIMTWGFTSWDNSICVCHRRGHCATVYDIVHQQCSAMYITFGLDWHRACVAEKSKALLWDHVYVSFGVLAGVHKIMLLIIQLSVTNTGTKCSDVILWVCVCVFACSSDPQQTPQRALSSFDYIWTPSAPLHCF